MTIGTDLLFADDFDREDGPLGSDWTLRGGSAIGIVSGEVRTTGTMTAVIKTLSVNSLPATENANYRVVTQVDGRTGAFFRGSGEGSNVSGYFVGRNGSNYEFSRADAGTLTVLSQGYVGSSWIGAIITAEVETVDGDVVLRIKSTNNSTVYTVTDSSEGRILSDGYLGLITTATNNNQLLTRSFEVYGTLAGGGATITTITGDGLYTVRAGESFTVAGSGFEAAQGSGTVTLGGVACTVTSWSDTEIEATAPASGLMFGGSKSLVVTPDSNDADTVSITYLPPTGQAHVTYDGSTVTERSVFWDDGIDAPIAGLATGDQCRYELRAVRDGGSEECDVVVEDGTGVITLANVDTAGDYEFDVWIRDATDGSDSAAKTVLVDSTPPPGTVSWDQDQITDANETSASFTFAGVEVGVDYGYEITSDAGGTPVEDSGTFATSTDQVTGVDVSGLNDGELTLTVTMTDAVGNETVITDTIGKAAADETAPQLNSATINAAGTSLTLGFDEIVSVGSGGNGGWSLSVSGASLTYSSGSGTSSLVYTVARAIGSHETPTVSYTQPGNGIEDGAGNDLASLSGFGVTNNSTVDGIAPVLQSATIGSSGQAITLQFNEAVSFGAGGNGGFALSLGGAPLTYSFGSGTSSLVYSIGRVVGPLESGTLSYVQPGDGVQDASGNDLASLSGFLVTNNSTADVIAPQLVSVSVNAAGNQITVTLNEAAAVGAGGGAGLTIDAPGGAVTAAYDSVAGNGVVYTPSRTIYAAEVLAASYTQPGEGITDTAGNELASFTDESVVNNSAVNSPPTDISLSRNTVRTNAGLNALVGTLTATDPDVGDTHTFSLVTGTGDTDNASFSISGNQLLCDDPETLGAGTYSVRIQVNDGADTFAKAFSITVQEVSAGSFIRDPVTVSITIEVTSEVSK